MLIYYPRGSIENQRDYSGTQIGIFKRKVASTKQYYYHGVYYGIYPGLEKKCDVDRDFIVDYLNHWCYGTVIFYRIIALKHPPLSTYPRNKTKMVELKVVSPKNLYSFLDSLIDQMAGSLLGTKVIKATVISIKMYHCKLGSLPKNLNRPKRFYHN